MRTTSARRRQRHGATFVTKAKRSSAKAVPAPKDGQVRCPVCRNCTRLTVYGYLRAHRDLFGHDCQNKAIAA